MPRSRTRLALLLATGTVILAGCGASTEPGSGTFYREHAAEARRVAVALTALQQAANGLGTSPSRDLREALAVKEHEAHRALLAASNWTVAENGEEEGVSQAEKEIHEGVQSLLSAISELRLYALKLKPTALAAYRHDEALGREYWNQGVREIWHVSRKPGPPTI